MLTVTNTACEHLAGLLTNAPAESVVRLVPAENRLALTLGAVQAGDATYQHGEQTVLAMDEVVSQALTEKALDIESSEQGPKLAIT